MKGNSSKKIFKSVSKSTLRCETLTSLYFLFFVTASLLTSCIDDEYEVPLEYDFVGYYHRTDDPYTYYYLGLDKVYKIKNGTRTVFGEWQEKYKIIETVEGEEWYIDINLEYPFFYSCKHQEYQIIGDTNTYEIHRDEGIDSDGDTKYQGYYSGEIYMGTDLDGNNYWSQYKWLINESDTVYGGYSYTPMLARGTFLDSFKRQIRYWSGTIWYFLPHERKIWFTSDFKDSYCDFNTNWEWTLYPYNESTHGSYAQYYYYDLSPVPINKLSTGRFAFETPPNSGNYEHYEFDESGVKQLNQSNNTWVNYGSWVTPYSEIVTNSDDTINVRWEAASDSILYFNGLWGESY